jgi:hypothetical protein
VDGEKQQPQALVSVELGRTSLKDNGRLLFRAFQ